MLSADTLETRRHLAELAARYHTRGWMLGTSGNLSARAHQNRVVVTASGCDKGQLGLEDFVEVTLDGTIVAAGPGRVPSAETTIHLAIYRGCSSAQAALHVHTVESTLLERRDANPTVYECRGFEMVKGWGLWEENAQASLPVFVNHARVSDIADDIARWMAPEPRVPALVIERHGITAWGADLQTAHRHLEVTEFLCGVLRASGAER